MMDYEVFKNVIATRIKEFLPPVYELFEIKFHEFHKINCVKEAMILELTGTDFRVFTPNIYMDDLYEAFQKKESLDYIFENLSQMIIEYTGYQMTGQGAPHLEKYKDHVVKTVVNKEKNRELLEDSPHGEFLDLAVIYRLAVRKDDESGYAITMVNNGVCKEMGLSAEELDQLAEENNERILEPKMLQLASEMYVLTTKDNFYGAVNLMRNDVLQEAADSLEDDLYIMPTSIHEIMVVKASRNDPELIRKMLKEGNQTVVDVDEYLSDSVYFFSREKGEVSVVE